MAYTLPYLDRHEEARAAAKKLQFMFPGVTIEVALQLYSLYCFPEDYLSQMKKGLQMAGLPERGDSSDLSNIQMPKTHIVKLEDWEVEYRDVGSGQPVVFVHGSMSDYRTWLHYQNPVSEKHRFISYSRRYYGSQSWQDQGERDTPQQHAKDLEGFLEHLNTGPVVLVSWSSGTPIATLLALTRPDLVSGMVLYEPNTLHVDDPTDADFPETQKEQFLGTFGRIFDYLDAGKTELATKAFLEAAFESQPGEFETELMWIRRVVLDSVATVPINLANETTEPSQEIDCEDLAGLETPVRVLMGELTNELWQYRARKFVECAPNATLFSIAGVNHAGPIRVPERVFEHIENFIGQL